MLINMELIWVLEHWEGTGNLGIGKTQVKPVVLLPSWGSRGNPRRPWGVSGVTPDEQRAAGDAAEESGKVADGTEKWRGEGMGRKNSTRRKEGHWCKQPRGAPAIPGAAEQALMGSATSPVLRGPS